MESNHLEPPYIEPTVLQTAVWITPHVVYLARPAGVEPATPKYVARYSIQMSYGRIVWYSVRELNPSPDLERVVS